ncbi:MAG: hypothetical protein M3063_01975 [Actinomycetota bacterium]|nr:hypothetical protein [Actinomycetota bacterium]
MALSERERALVIVPMFHVNAWGYPYVCWMTGADMVMPSLPKTSVGKFDKKQIRSSHQDGSLDVEHLS